MNKKSNIFDWLKKPIAINGFHSKDLKKNFLQRDVKSYSFNNFQYGKSENLDEQNKKENLNEIKNFDNEFSKSKEEFSKKNLNFYKEKGENLMNRKKSRKFMEKFNQSSSKSRFQENSKQQVVSITYEEIGLFPRSFNRVFDRFFKQLFFDVENLVIQEYRFYRYLFLTTVKCVFILLFVPLTVNFFAKNYFVRPITEYYWNSNQVDIFLNSYQQKKAFLELKNYEEKIYFESLIFPRNSSRINLPCSSDLSIEKEIQDLKSKASKNSLDCKKISKDDFSNSKITEEEKMNQNQQFLFTQSIQNRFQIQTVELAKHYNEESIEAITNFFADIISLSTLFLLLRTLEIQINITKSFLLEVFFGLDDSKKSLLILFLTDLLVGYHSPNIWELFFSTIFDHYGFPESQTTIFLLVATLPVLLDVLFKYLIFRHLNRASPATVATYHAMIE